MLKCILKKQHSRALIGFIWLSIWRNGVLLCTQRWTSVYTMWKSPWLIEKLSAVQQVSSSWQQLFRVRSSPFWDVMHNTLQERRPHLQRDGSPQSPAAADVSQFLHYTQLDSTYSELSLFQKTKCLNAVMFLIQRALFVSDWRFCATRSGGCRYVGVTTDRGLSVWVGTAPSCSVDSAYQADCSGNVTSLWHTRKLNWWVICVNLDYRCCGLPRQYCVSPVTWPSCR